MSRPLQDARFDELERYLAEAQSTSLANSPAAAEARLRTLLHELSFRGPDFAGLKDRAEQARIQMIIANANQKARAAKLRASEPPQDAAEAQPAKTVPDDSAIEPSVAVAFDDEPHIEADSEPHIEPLSRETPLIVTPAAMREAMNAAHRMRGEDFPGFNPGLMLDMTPDAPVHPDEMWRRPQTHIAIAAVAIVGLIGLAGAYAKVPAGAFGGIFSDTDRTSQIIGAANGPMSSAGDLPQLRNMPVGTKAGDIEAAGATATTPGLAPEPANPPNVALASAALPQPDGAAAKPSVRKLAVTTALMNMYAGEGPAIAKAAVAAAGLGVNNTVRWKNERSGRHGTITLTAQDKRQPNCYTARIMRLDMRAPEQRTERLCF